MGSHSVSSCLLVILNSIHLVLGIGISAVSIWYFIELYAITSLRNPYTRQLDMTLFWPEVIPWVFLAAGVLILFVSCCGFAGAAKRNKHLVVIYIMFEVLAVIALASGTTLSLYFADSNATDKFIKETFTDAFNFKSLKIDVSDRFGRIEERLQCCGADSPMDYNGLEEYPISCCDTTTKEWQSQLLKTCGKDDKLARQRHGCSQVAIRYSRLIFKALSSAAAFAAMIGVLNVIIALCLTRTSRKRVKKYAESDFSTIEK